VRHSVSFQQSAGNQWWASATLVHSDTCLLPKGKDDTKVETNKMH